MPPRQSSTSETSTRASVAALILGMIAAVFVFIPLFGIVVAGPAAVSALVCGLVGIAREEEGTATHKGVAMAGTLLGLGSTTGVIVVIAAAIGPVRLAARSASRPRSSPRSSTESSAPG